MATRKAPNIADYFSGAKQTQQLSNAEAEIAQLKAEIENLRISGSQEVEAQLSILKEQLRSQSGVIDLDITQIIQNPDQPRRTFLPESIESMSQSLAADDQLSPIIVIAQGDQYLLFDGERRWRAANRLGWSKIKAVIMDAPQNLHRKALLTSLHREDLNPLDKAEALIKEISLNTNLKPNQIPRILSTVIRRLNKQKRLPAVIATLSEVSPQQNSELEDQPIDATESIILKILLELQLNPASVDANLMPMLGLAEDLKNAIRHLGLKGVHAIALQKLSAKNLNLPTAKAKRLRESLTKQTIKENWSVLQTRKQVNAAIAKHNHSHDLNTTTTSNKQLGKVKQAIEMISPDLLKSTNPESIQDIYTLLKQKIQELEHLMP